MANDNSGVLGQQGLTDAGSQFNRESFLHHQMLGRASTMKLVKIVKVHNGGGALAQAGTVDVIPLVNQVDGQGNSTEHGTVYGLQYTRVQGGSFAIIHDPVVGDIGYAVVSDRDTSSVIANGGKQSNPGSNRRFDIADGVFIGGILNQTPTMYIQATPGTGGGHGSLTIADGNGNIIKMENGDISITATTLKLTGDLAVTGKITATANITAGQGTGDQVTLQNHLHSGVQPGSGNTSTPVAGT